MPRPAVMDAEVQGEPERAGGVAAVDRALNILAAIAAQPEPRTLVQLASATGLYKSTILRLLGSLEAAGFARRLHDGRYALGPAAFRLGLAYERANPLRHHIAPILRALVASGSESASFHVRDGADRRLCLLRIDSTHPTLDRIRAGDILPLDRGAAGRILHAFSDVSGDAGGALRAEGFAFTAGEREVGCSGMAAPVFGPDGTLAGAMSLSGPSSRFTPDNIAEWRPKLLAAAAAATHALGGSLPDGKR